MGISVQKANTIFQKWTGRTKTLWLPPQGSGFWLKARPKWTAKAAPSLHAPGAKLFKTQPDGLYLFFYDTEYVDAVCVEVCNSIQNLQDKRPRYMSASHSLLATCNLAWLTEDMPVQGQGTKIRWKACGTILDEPEEKLVLPVRFLRVLYALPDTFYDSWVKNHTPSGHEYYCLQSSLSGMHNQNGRAFLRQMGEPSHFFTKPYK